MLEKTENKTLINCQGKLIDLSTPQIMGILNLTPDSFFSGSRVENKNQLIETAVQMIEQGASFLDIGAYSSRPGASDISVEEELNRIQIIEDLHKEIPDAILSIDTFRSEVAREAISMGAAIVNDISAGQLDPQMFKTIAELQVPYIMMHMRGTPQTMKTLTDYDNIITDMNLYFSQRIEQLVELGVNDIILDPGIGFAKTVDQNFQVLRMLEAFQVYRLPLLVGLSRKSLINKTLGIKPSEALNGTTALNMLALNNGAKILRVHDVKEAMEAVRLYNSYVGGNS